MNKTMYKLFKRLEEIERDYDVEIISYGLSPNPFGYCYETEEELNENIAKELNYLCDIAPEGYFNKGEENE